MKFFRRKSNSDLVVVQLSSGVDDYDWLGDGSTYYWVRSDIGQICKSKWEDKVPHHHFRLSIGNVFRTRKQAKEAILEQQRWFKNREGK